MKLVVKLFNRAKYIILHNLDFQQEIAGIENFQAELFKLIG